MSQQLFAPTNIEHLPVEVVHRIFIFNCQINNSRDQRGPLRKLIGTLNPNDFPWNVASVSRTWRDIALSCPGFWSTIDLDLANFYHVHPSWIFKAQPVIQRMLKRSGRAPITFIFQDHSSSSIPAHNIMKLLIEHSERWADIRLKISLNLLETLTAVRGRVPLLSNLELEPYNPLEFPRAPFTAFEIAPRLVSITFKNIADFELFRLPFQQLKIFKGPIYQGYKLARQIPLLEECEIDYDSNHSPAQGSIPLERPHLRRLVTNSIRSFSLGFDVPALTSLTIYYKRITNSVQDVNHFIERNQCSLTRLLISGSLKWSASPEDDSFGHLFRLVRQLTYLEITEHSQRFLGPPPIPWHAISRHLTITDSSLNPLVPRLAEIAFTVETRLAEESINKLKELISSRTSYFNGEFRAMITGKGFRLASMIPKAGLSKA